MPVPISPTQRELRLVADILHLYAQWCAEQRRIAAARVEYTNDPAAWEEELAWWENEEHFLSVLAFLLPDLEDSTCMDLSMLDLSDLRE